MCKIIEIDPKTPDPKVILQACDILEAGGLVVVPTETVYGIACAPEHIEALYCAKERDRGKPIARLAASLKQVQALGADFGRDGLALADKYWPGSLTLVLNTPEGTTGFRVPDHEVPLALARAFGRPIALTSANKSGGADATNAQDAFQTLKAAVPLFLDAGETSTKVPSTVVLCTEDGTRILREGSIAAEELKSYTA